MEGPHPVDSIVFTVVIILLTWIVEGVKSNSFFDISKVIPVGGENRGPSKDHLAAAQAENVRRVSEGL